MGFVGIMINGLGPEEITEMQKENKQIKEELHDLADRTLTRIAEIRKLEKENKELQRARDEAIQGWSEMEGKLRRAEAEAKKEKEENVTLNVLLATTVEEKIRKVNFEIQEKEKESKHLREENNRLNNALHKACKERDEMRKELENYSNLNEFFMLGAPEAEEKFNALKITNFNIREQIKSLQQKRKEDIKVIKGLQEEIGKKEAEKEEIKTEVQKHRFDREIILSSLNYWKKDAENYRKQLEKAIIDREALQKMAESLTKDNERLEMEVKNEKYKCRIISNSYIGVDFGDPFKNERLEILKKNQDLQERLNKFKAKLKKISAELQNYYFVISIVNNEGEFIDFELCRVPRIPGIYRR